MGLGEDSGKKERIREFLDRISNGLGYIEDIWIDRKLKPPSSGENYSSGRSLSGKSVQTLGELLKDDIEHTFEKGLFTFRFIAAVPGSGKTTTLSYLKELIDNNPEHQHTSVVVNFAFNELLSQPGSDVFGVKFYSAVFLKTLWDIFGREKSEISDRIKDAAKDFLIRVTNKEKVALIEANADEKIMFENKLNSLLEEIKVNFKDLFFQFIKYISKKEPQAKFVYLIDELDALHAHQDYLNDARSVMRDLINTAVDFQKLRLMVYIVGRQDDVQSFIMADEALRSRVSNSVIKLVPCRMEECEQIRKNIEERLRGAYSGCKDFDKAWSEIKDIQLEVPHDFNTLREFCKKYVQGIIEIHEKYFKFFDESFNKYEGRAREILEREVRQHWFSLIGDCADEVSLPKDGSFQYLGHSEWKKFKGKQNHTLLIAQTTTNYKKHNLDCYIELRHREDIIAQAYGEAKNYKLIQEHLSTFFEWLEDFDYRTSSEYDLAFMIAPACSDQKLLKLHKKAIRFVAIDKIEDFSQLGDGFSPNEEKNKRKPIQEKLGHSSDINGATLSELQATFKGARIQRKLLDKIIGNRPYVDLKNLFEKVSLSEKTKNKILAKHQEGEIYFS
ncbi:hypothetical protein [Adonisia turfae]|uniref:Uncharacterized protein n=1 Tax=Adonisia turfae CCMR0081 TaxID=2292702 RepID=A0A6M0RIB9_9CYAN|nr:hypothetical protein [Adonisia turfae]NEZ55954.1 hypothetical protein [Adonisia turfae CCMR0081]